MATPGAGHARPTLPGAMRGPRPETRPSGLAFAWDCAAGIAALSASAFLVFLAATLWDSTTEWVDKAGDSGAYVAGLVASALFALFARTIACKLRSATPRRS